MSVLASSAPVTAATPHRSVVREWALVTLIAVAAGWFAATYTAWALPVALAPVGVVALAKYRLATLWVLSLEMALGGWGHAVYVGGLPMRHLMLMLVLGAWIVVKVLHADWRLRGGSHGVTTALFLAMIVVAVQASLGNPFLWQDAATPFFLLLLYPFADIAARPRGAETLLRMFVICVFVLGVFQCLLTLGTFAGVINGHQLYLVFQERFGGVTHVGGPFWRVFIVGSIYFQIVILILAAGLLAGQPLFGRRADQIALAVVGAGLIFTYTRGFWATTILGFGVLAWLTTERGRRRWAVTALAGALVVVLLIPLADASVVDVLGQRIARTFDPDRDVSVALRLDLYPRVLGRVLERPLLGYGFGQLVEGQLYYENSYLYYAVKFGILGLLVLAIVWIVLLWDGVRLARRHPDAAIRARAAGLTAAMVSMLIVTSINPFINSPVGFYFQTLTAAILYGFGLRAPGAAATGDQDEPAAEAARP
jgi:O-antigen ligase